MYSAPTTPSRLEQPPVAASTLWLAAAIPVLLLGGALFVLDPVKYLVLEAAAGHRNLFTALLGAAASLASRWIPLVLLIGIAALILARRERRGADLSRALADAPLPAFGVLGVALLLWFVQAYLYSGLLLGGDTGSQLVRLLDFGRGLRAGEVLFWNNNYYLGAPFLQFYPPLFMWLGGGLYALTGSAEWAPKVLLLALHVVGAWFCFALIRRVGCGRFAALVGALAYAGAWAHGHLILYQGVLPQSVTMALLPAAFFVAELLIQRGSLGGAPLVAVWSWLALLSAGLLCAHQAHGLFAGVYLAAYVVLRAFGRDRPIRLLLVAGSAGAAGVVMALFAIIPFIAEQSWVMASVGDGGGFFAWRWPDMEYLRHLLTWYNGRTTYGSDSAAYLGLTVVALGVAAVIPLSRRRHSPVQGWAVAMLGGLLLSMVWRGSLVREIIFTLFFISMLAAVGTQRLIAAFPERRHLPALILILLFIDLGSTAVQPLARADKDYLLAAGEYLAATAPNQRVAISSNRVQDGSDRRPLIDIGPDALPLQYASLQTVSGTHNHAATLVHNYAVTILKRAERDLGDYGTLTPDALALLAMLNVGRIVNDTGAALGFPPVIQPTMDEPPLGRVIRIATPSPVVFAPGLVQLAPAITLDRPMLWAEDFKGWTAPQVVQTSAFLDAFLHAMRYRPETRTAARIPVRERPAGGIETADSQGPEASVAIVDYRVSMGRVDLRVDLSEAGFLQLSHPWYPMLEIRHNGTVIEPLRGSLNLLVVPANQGENVYSIIPRRSALRRLCGWLSAVTLGVVLIAPLAAAVGRRRFGRMLR